MLIKFKFKHWQLCSIKTLNKHIEHSFYWLSLSL